MRCKGWQEPLHGCRTPLPLWLYPSVTVSPLPASSPHLTLTSQLLPGSRAEPGCPGFCGRSSATRSCWSNPLRPLAGGEKSREMDERDGAERKEKGGNVFVSYCSNAHKERAITAPALQHRALGAEQKPSQNKALLSSALTHATPSKLPTTPCASEASRLGSVPMCRVAPGRVERLVQGEELLRAQPSSCGGVKC